MLSGRLSPTKNPNERRFLGTGHWRMASSARAKEVIPPFSPLGGVFRGRRGWTPASLVTLAHFKHGPEISRDLNVSSFGILLAKERNLPKFARDFERLQYLGDC